MLQKLSKNRGGFTLVEIMIVVAIIALLAAIAVPNFLRARKRSQATKILEDLRIIEGAKDQYAIERNKSGGVEPTWSDLAPYIKKTTALYLAAGYDPFGREYEIGAVDGSTLAATETYNEFSDIGLDNSFWIGFGR